MGNLSSTCSDTFNTQYLLSLVTGAFKHVVSSAPMTIQTATLQIIRASENDFMTGTQPMDQSKHSHQGFTRSQALMEYR